MSAPLYLAKAEFFKALAHPARIRVLELLSEREYAVSEMLPEVGLEAAHLSQQLSVLRKMNLVVTRKEGSTVFYSLVSPQVAELLAVARRILTEVLVEPDRPARRSAGRRTAAGGGHPGPARPFIDWAGASARLPIPRAWSMRPPEPGDGRVARLMKRGWRCGSHSQDRFGGPGGRAGW